MARAGPEKAAGSAGLAYGPHTRILSIARARYELKQLLCCYINPDVSVKMSYVMVHSEFDSPRPPPPKKIEKKKE